MLINPARLLVRARAQGRALAAFNIYNLETLQGVAAAAARAGVSTLQASPDGGICQRSAWSPWPGRRPPLIPRLPGSCQGLCWLRNASGPASPR